VTLGSHEEIFKRWVTFTLLEEHLWITLSWVCLKINTVAEKAKLKAAKAKQKTEIKRSGGMKLCVLFPLLWFLTCSFQPRSNIFHLVDKVIVLAHGYQA
jgi:hypothetical protein